MKTLTCDRCGQILANGDLELRIKTGDLRTTLAGEIHLCREHAQELAAWVVKPLNAKKRRSDAAPDLGNAKPSRKGRRSPETQAAIDKFWASRQGS